MGFTGGFATLASLSALNVALTEAIVKFTKVEKKWLKQLISWLFPVLLSCVGFLAQLGLFADYGTIAEWQGWVFTLLTGVGLGLVSNGLYDIQGVKSLIEWIESLLKKKSTKTLLTEETKEVESGTTAE